MWESDTDKDGLSCKIRIRKLHALPVADSHPPPLSVCGLRDEIVSQNLLKLLGSNGRLSESSADACCLVSVVSFINSIKAFRSEGFFLKFELNNMVYREYNESTLRKVIHYLLLLIGITLFFLPQLTRGHRPVRIENIKDRCNRSSSPYSSGGWSI